jgi:serine/threonine protein kinase
VYELISGHPPFEGLDAMARYKKILQGINQARFEPASRFSEDAIDLIKSVCDKDPSQRLPMKPGGVKKNLYTHPLYEADKWEKLDNGTLTPPLKPKVRSPKDIGNFGYFAEEDCPPHVPYVDPGTGWDKDF